MNHTDKESEKLYLKETLQVIEDNLKNYSSEVTRMQAEIDEMLEHYHDNDVELWTILNNTITLNDHMKRNLERNERARHKPYFGRIIFHDETLDKEESLYIGKGGISRDNTNWMVVDWRAPVANAYYENGLGKCSYAAPGGKELPIDLQLKRTFEIEEGNLLDYFDTEVIANDDLLMKYLSKNKEAVLGEIVATIQKEQNEIIRKSPYHNIIVQGVAGSGKTTVAMHRISFILYNYQERFKPEDFYIVGSNRILLNYITGVLPDLDVYGVRQMTMEQLFIRLLYEDWDDKKYRVKPVSGSRDIVKGTEQWYLDLEAFIRRLEWDTIPRDSVLLSPRQFVEGLQDGKSGIYDRREEDERAGIPPRPVRLIEQDAVERYITQNPSVSIQSKINMLNERLIIKVKDEFLGKGVKYTEGERKAILKAYRGYYGSSQWKKSIYELYKEFLSAQKSKGLDVEQPTDAFDVYDLAALALLYKRVKETEVISEAHHIVIDEAQDFGMMAYRVLHTCIKDCTYTVMGDVSQNIHFGYGLGDWEALRRLLLSDPMDSFGILKKSYRNTVEISEFATNILKHGSFSIYPVEPIIRHGKEVTVEELQEASESAFAERAAQICRSWQEEGYDTIAVVCRDNLSAQNTAKLLSRHIEIMESDLEKANFGSGILVLPVEYTKGLEFDAVLIWNPTRKDYPADDGDAKLLYVAATRALHELHILYKGNLTGLIADPVPERNQIAPFAGKGEKSAVSDRTKALGESNASEKLKASGKSETSEKPKTSEVQDASQKPKAVSTVRPRVKITPKVIITAGTDTPASSGQSKPSMAASQNVKPVQTVNSYLNNKLSASKPLQQSIQPKGNSSVMPFGDMPATEILRPKGHAKINLGVRWISRQPDGLYLQSQYGILRISPVSGSIIRMTFAKGSKLTDGVHPLIAADRAEKNWKFRDNGKIAELTTGEVIVQIEKVTGAVTYLTAKGTILLAEKKQEGRQLEIEKNWLYLDWQKGEQLFAMGPEGQGGLKLRNSAHYISRDNELPFVLSDRGYGILTAASGNVICCDVPAYGSYLSMEGQEQQDYYFIAGKQQNILNAYAYLCGTL